MGRRACVDFERRLSQVMENQRRNHRGHRGCKAQASLYGYIAGAFNCCATYVPLPMAVFIKHSDLEVYGGRSDEASAG
jgi:hypothetical protein